MARIYLTRDLSRGVAEGVSPEVAEQLARFLRRDPGTVFLLVGSGSELVWLDA